MTKFNRINSKVVAEKVENYITEYLSVASDNHDEKSIDELIKHRIVETEFSNIGKDYINAYDVAELMTRSALDFEHRTYYQKEFLDDLKLSYDDVNEKYDYVIAYYLDKMFDIGVRLNHARKNKLAK